MKKTTRTIIMASGIVIILIGLLVFLRSQNKVIYGVSAGTYSVIGEDELFLPSITFDLQHDSFYFTHDLLSSYADTGTIEIRDGKVIATTDDNKFTYIFEVIDNDTLRFVQKGSAKITTRPGNAVIVDGTEFKFTGERS